MIPIAKPDEPPAKLFKGKELTVEDCRRFEADPCAFEGGAELFNIRRDVYGDETVKEALRTAQHKKCCFCEGLFLEAHAAADVEHYRPKGFSQQARRAPKIYPGYYWLAYDWDNLFYCCESCNRFNKRNYFPLRNPNERVRSHLGDVTSESPLILKPNGPDNPRGHIQFREEVAIAISDAGDATIDFVGLNRLPLIEKRLGVFNALKRIHEVARVFRRSRGAEQRQVVAEARAYLIKARQPQAEFSAMASDFLQVAGIP